MFALKFDVRKKSVEIKENSVRFIFEVLSGSAKDMVEHEKDLLTKEQGIGKIKIVPMEGNFVSIEVGSVARLGINLCDALTSFEFLNAKGELDFVVGRNAFDKILIEDLSCAPHMLVGGASGSGKSIFLNDIICSIIGKYSPEHVRFILVDTKCSEFLQYDGEPHMLTRKAIDNVYDAFGALDYLIDETERRFMLFREKEVASVKDYNKLDGTARLPYIVLVIDELIDIISFNKKMFESRLIRLAQKCRAAGIFLIVSTQFLRNDVITGTLKANLPFRVGMRVFSEMESQILLAAGGAEKLSCPGDMLVKTTRTDDLIRARAPYVSVKDVARLCLETKRKYAGDFDESIAHSIFVSLYEPNKYEPTRTDTSAQADPLCKKVLRFWLEERNGEASIASAQRAFVIGFNRAGRILEYCQSKGYVTKYDEADEARAPLKVRISIDDLNRLFPDSED